MDLEDLSENLMKIFEKNDDDRHCFMLSTTVIDCSRFTFLKISPCQRSTYSYDNSHKVKFSTPNHPK